MKTSFLILSIVSSLISIHAQADVAWVGNAQLNVVRRGNYSSRDLDGRTLEINVCDYGMNDITFEVYKPSVTDVDGVPVWQAINAGSVLVKDSNGATMASLLPQVTGRIGNNAAYKLWFQGMFPSAVTGLDPASVNAHLLISLDGRVEISVPVHFRCEN